MNEFQIYLALRDVEGKHDKEATLELVSAYNEGRPTDSKKLNISPSMVSRVRQGHLIRGPKRELLQSAIGHYLAIHGERYGIGEMKDLEAKLRHIAGLPGVSDAIARHERTGGSRKRAAIPNTHKLGHELEERLLGVWQQFNITCAETGKSNPPKLRCALRLFYRVGEEVATICLGKRTDWSGKVSQANRFIHLTERQNLSPYAEIAHYMFGNSSVAPTMEPETLVGAIQVVFHNQYPHIFVGKVVFRKLDDLSEVYKSQPNKFNAAAGELREKYCKLFALPDVDFTMPVLKGMQSILNDHLKSQPYANGEMSGGYEYVYVD